MLTQKKQIFLWNEKVWKSIILLKAACSGPAGWRTLIDTTVLVQRRTCLCGEIKQGQILRRCKQTMWNMFVDLIRVLMKHHHVIWLAPTVALKMWWSQISLQVTAETQETPPVQSISVPLERTCYRFMCETPLNNTQVVVMATIKKWLKMISRCWVFQLKWAVSWLATFQPEVCNDWIFFITWSLKKYPMHHGKFTCTNLTSDPLIVETSGTDLWNTKGPVIHYHHMDSADVLLRLFWGSRVIL